MNRVSIFSMLIYLTLILHNTSTLFAYAQTKSNDNIDDSSEPNDFASTIIDIAKESVDVISHSDIFNKASTSLHDLFETGVPGKITFGYAMGYCSGYFIKKSVRVLAFAVGGMFAIVQYLSSHGYVNVNYAILEKQFEDALDLNEDGKVDSKDLEAGYKKILLVSQYNLPSGGGFGAGLLIGLRA